MASENRLPFVIFAILLALIVVPLLVVKIRDSRRPVLEEARLVTATNTDPVFREGPRHVGPGEVTQMALALRIGYPGGRQRWLAPVDELQIDGQRVDHLVSADWPESKRAVRVFWFTVECTNVGGTISVGNAAKRLRYRPFLAPEMGNGLRAAALPEAHNDDHLGPQPDVLPVDAGTLRLYARIEVFAPETDFRPLQAASTAGVDRLLDPSYPSIHKSVVLADTIDSSVGELFLLPGFEASSGTLDEIGDAAFGLSFLDLVNRRFMVSSRAFAATAISGAPIMSDDDFEPITSFSILDGSYQPGRRPLRWGAELRSGDLLVDGDHYSVLVADNGNGLLDDADAVIHCWRRPPAMMTLGTVFAETTTEVRVLRHGG